MTTVFLVRHADHDMVGQGLAGRLAVPLNAAGHGQAARLAGWFARQPVTAVWSSPLRRTLETAEPIARGLGLAVDTDDALLEVDFGAWEGKSFAELDEHPAWRRWNGARARARAPGGETIAEVQARLCGFINDRCDEAPDGTLVLVSHGDPIRAALAYYLGVPIDLFLRIEVAPASVSVLAIDGWGPRVLCLNQTIEHGPTTDGADSGAAP